MAEPIPKYYLYKRIVESKLYIDRNFSDDLTIEELADISHFSKYHYIKLFRLAYHITPIQYLRKKRFLEAKKLLNSNKTIFDICTEVGYSSPSTFALEFKKYEGVCPSTYKKLSGLEKIRDGNHIPGCFFRQIENRNFR